MFLAERRKPGWALHTQDATRHTSEGTVASIGGLSEARIQGSVASGEWGGTLWGGGGGVLSLPTHGAGRVGDLNGEGAPGVTWQRARLLSD